MRIVPTERPRAGANSSETKLYEAFKSQAAETDWIVLHSIQIGPNSEYLEGETDFYVMVPGLGIVAVEAKAPTSVEYREGNWYLPGTPNPKKSPLEQVNRSRRVMKRFLHEHGFGDDIPVARLIWFTSINRWQFDPSARGDMQYHEWELAWKGDLSSVISTVRATLNSYLSELTDAAVTTLNQEKLTEELAVKISQTIFADFKIEVSETELAVERAESFAKATEQQLQILGLIESNKHLYFQGAAGTGKSFLLRETVVRARQQEKRVLYTCWNVMMAEHLGIGFASHDANLTITDINRLMLNFANLDANPEGADNEWFEQELPERALAGLARKPHLARFSYIVIDEFQDLVGKLKVIEFLFQLGAAGGLAETKIVLAGDDRQMLLVDSLRYKTGYEFGQFFINDLVHVTLDQNCRMSPRLHRQMAEYLGFKLGVKSDRLPDQTSGDLLVVEAAEDQQAAVLHDVLQDLLKSHSPEEIRVLSPFGEKRSLAGRIISSEGRSATKKWLKRNLKSTDSSGQIRWRSIPKFKGLESEIVVLTDINQAAVDFANSLGQSISDWLYVGISRARHRCVILQQSGFDWRAYEAALRATNRPQADSQSISPSEAPTS